MDKYSAGWVEQQVRDRKATRLMHHPCGGCGCWVAYYFGPDGVTFDPSCDCCHGLGPRPSSFDEISDWLVLQSSDLTRDGIMSRLA